MRRQTANFTRLRAAIAAAVAALPAAAGVAPTPGCTGAGCQAPQITATGASVEVNAGDGEVSFNTRTCGRFDPCSDHGMVADVIAALASLRDV